MCVCWLKRDIDSAEFICRAKLEGWRLVFNKESEDGSGKANIEESRDDSVHGVIYEVDEAEKNRLNKKEVRYDPIPVSVKLEDGSTEKALTYKSDYKTGEPPYEWYLKLIIGGAKTHGLPEEYIKTLESINTKPIPIKN